MTIEKLKQPTAKKQTFTAPITTDDEDPFPYGWRYVFETTPDGQETYRQVPLTQADFLDPQLGDRMVQNNKHFQLIRDLVNMLEIHYLNQPTTAIFSDLKMIWGIAGLKEPAPDVAIVPNIKNKNKRRDSFKVKEEGVKPCLVIEVISPRYPGDDTEKVDIYEQAGILEYIIINPYTGENGMECELTGYRLIEEHYQKIQLDEEGRLFSETTGVYFGKDESKENIVLVDVFSNKRLLTHKEIEEARLKEKEARLKVEAELNALKAKLQRDE